MCVCLCLPDKGLNLHFNCFLACSSNCATGSCQQSDASCTGCNDGSWGADCRKSNCVCVLVIICENVIVFLQGNSV